ncbi:hypothetical protein G9A89_019739 [Geosiphon pyriformis]|nr:hypothetical protein G9A89_019739 [Geosiphon pyriformis]
MDSLEFDLRGLILDSLAHVLSFQISSTNESDLARLLAQCPPLPEQDVKENQGRKLEDLGIMTKSYQQSILSLAGFAGNTTSIDHLVDILPHLLHYLKNLPAFSFEENITWKAYSLPDELVDSLISELLMIGNRYSEKREKIVESVMALLETLTETLKCGNGEHICTVVLPLLNGSIRAIQNSHFPWKMQEFLFISHLTQKLLHSDSVSLINEAINSVLLIGDQKQSYGKRILSKYELLDAPLSANAIIVGLLRMTRNILARFILSIRNKEDNENGLALLSFPSVWSILTNSRTIITNTISEDLRKVLRRTYVMALEYFTELATMVEDLLCQGKECPSGLYSRDIMSICLDLAGVCSIYLQEIDDELLSILSSSLFNIPQTPDIKVQTAALDIVAMIALNYGQYTEDMIDIIRKFLLTPSPIFEFAVKAHNNITIQQYAIDRLAQCLKAANQDITISVINALLNSLSAGGKERPPSPVKSSIDPINQFSISRTEEQRQQIYENIVCTITGITCIIRDEKITDKTVSLLILRLRNDTPPLEALILEKLVDVALIASEPVFHKIIEKFSAMSKELILSQENKLITTAVLKCQKYLAQRIDTRPEFYGLYMLKILTLFVDKGVVIQKAISQNGRVKVTSLAGELGILLPVLKALLAHQDFKAHLNPSTDLVDLFCNVWFHCVLCGFVSETSYYREWHDSLSVIAQKTPPLVLENATNYLANDLQHNSALRTGKFDQDLANLRSDLCSILPDHVSEIRYFSFAEIVFLLSVYHIETMRSQLGNCSFILRYFVNQGIHDSKLIGCMEEIGDQVIKVFITECSRRAIAHTIDEEIRIQVRNMIIGICHRLEKVHRLSIKYVDAIMTCLPSLLCDKELVFLLLELIELVWQSCQAEYLNEYSPIYTFTSLKAGITLELPDSYSYRKEMLSSLCENVRKWLSTTMSHATMEISGILGIYLAEFDPFQSKIPIHMGCSIALEIGKSFPSSDYKSEALPSTPNAIVDNFAYFIGDYSARNYYRSQVTGAQYWLDKGDGKSPTEILDENVLEKAKKIKESLAQLKSQVLHSSPISINKVNNILHLAAGILIAMPTLDEDLIRYIVWIPIYIFSPESLKLATFIWNWVITEKEAVEKRIMVEIIDGWIWTLRHHKGLFSKALDIKDPFVNKMQYMPSDKNSRDRIYQLANYLFSPHTIWVQFLSNRFQVFRYQSPDLVTIYLRLFQITLDAFDSMSNHSLSREGRFKILVIGFNILEFNRMESLIEFKFRSRLYQAAFAWFSLRPRWAYGGNKRNTLADYTLLLEFEQVVENDKVELNEVLSSVPKKNSQAALATGIPIIIADKTRDDILSQAAQSKKLLLLFLKSEISRLATWCNPLNSKDQSFRYVSSQDELKPLIHHAWTISPRLAVQLMSRFQQTVVQKELHNLIANNAYNAVDISEALPLLLGDSLAGNTLPQLKYLLYWSPVPPITAITYFSPAYNDHPLVLQYAMRVLEYHPVDVVFFYIPQIVQALRYDRLGYVERFIMGAARISQLFAHQIIWNMKANMYKDEETVIPDALKPSLDRIINNIVESLSGEDKEFYEREFTFFDNVTSISGKLKPFVKKTKEEKKQKIDEEMHKIKVDVGVYLPSNPEGIVIGIDYKSGRPLQSHAKAPFMATFRIRKTKKDLEEIKETLIKMGADLQDSYGKPKTIDVWQSAIFKVGDDCRQDVLALQLIAIFKNIFTNVGLDLYLFPYRVVATAPGCGVIDVIPNSISRDQLGREKINNLYDYFLDKYGGKESIDFQKARNCFIQSVAAYSVVAYLLQIKDRHNGNIMLDDEGHIIHIDFGFILEIAPGGITFESSPFKLTTEMIQVMGGSPEMQPYKWFSELCVKAYLASRPYAEKIIQCVALMLGSGLPCFKGEKTLKNLRNRFQLDRTERGAADFMIERINQSYENRRTVLYDSFQKATNGIPH